MQKSSNYNWRIFYFWIFSKVFEKNFKKLKNQGVQNPKKFLFLDERVNLPTMKLICAAQNYN